MGILSTIASWLGFKPRSEAISEITEPDECLLTRGTVPEWYKEYAKLKEEYTGEVTFPSGVRDGKYHSDEFARKSPDQIIGEFIEIYNAQLPARIERRRRLAKIYASTKSDKNNPNVTQKS